MFKNLSLLALALCLLRGKGFKRVCVITLLLGLVFIGKGFADLTSTNNLGIDSDSMARFGYIVIWEQQDESDLAAGGRAPRADGTNSESREVAGWITIRYSPVTGYYELAWMTPGVFGSIASYNLAHTNGYNGLDVFYSKQQIYDPNTGEIYVPIENQSPKSLSNTN